MASPLPDNVRIYLVGGAVRDALLGLPAGDNDHVVVGASVVSGTSTTVVVVDSSIVVVVVSCDAAVPAHRQVPTRTNELATVSTRFIVAPLSPLARG